MKKRSITAILSVMVSAILLAGCGASSSGTSGDSASGDTAGSGAASSGDTIKLGVLLSTTGNFSLSETPMRNTAELAIDEINAAGGIAGKQIEPVYIDYGSDPSMAAEKAQEMILKDKVAAIVGTNSSATRLAVEPIIEQYDGLLEYNTFYEGEKPSDNLLYTNTVPNQQVDGFLPFIMENLGTKIFLVGSDYEFPKKTIAYAKTKIESMGGTIVGEEYAPTGTTDFSSIVNKIKASDAEVIFSIVAGNDCVYFYQDAQKYGIDMEKTPICSCACHESAVKGIGDAAVGSYSCFSYFNTLDTDANKEFIKKYTDKFGTDTTVTNSAEQTYSGIYLLKAAIEKAGSTKPDDIIAAAAGIEWDTPAGTIKMDDANHHAWLNTYIGKVNSDLTFDIVAQSDGLVQPIAE